MSVTGAFARFAADSTLPSEALAAARLCLLDWYGAAIAGANEAPAQALRRALPSTGKARLIADGAPSCPRTAALINGTASHTVEVDDIYRPGLYHPGVVTIPAALALAETESTDGGALLDAIAVGYEVGNRIAEAVNPAHYAYWHTTATVGHFGAAAAAARILRLDPDQTAHALATAATMAAGLRQAFSADAMAKPLHAGRAAEAGVLAALAAREGVTGVSDMLEGERGFAAAMVGTVDWASALRDLGKGWTITRTTPKAHACCGHCFAPLDAVQHLMDEHHLQPDAIAAIEISTYRAALDICGNPMPRTAAEGRFSLPWCAAVMATQGAVTPASFSDDAMASERTRALATLVTLSVDDGAEARFPHARSATVRIKLKDGAALAHDRATRKGDPDDPLSEAELQAKFHHLADPVVGTAAAINLAEMVRALGPGSGLPHLDQASIH
ncbi:MAG: MmgE/PrpD family protein [Pseudomonadota bacterium]